MRLAIFASHPIQYQAPFFRRLAQEKDLDFVAYFNWDFGVGREQYDPGFNRRIVWDTSLLDGYAHEFLKNISWRPSSASFWGEINPGAISAVWRGGYDAVLVYHWNYVTSWLIFLTAFLRGVPVIIRGENPLNQEFMKSSVKLALKRPVLTWLFRRAAALLYIGEENRKFYEYYGAALDKLFFSPYAVDNKAFMAEAHSLALERARLRRKLNLPADTPIILFAGKLIHKKRPLDLLRAYRLVQDVPSELVFLGDGALMHELKAHVEKEGLSRVHFAGFQNYSQVQRYYAAADIFVLPSGAGETWGLVVNEAMCFGLPIIVSDMVGCGPDLVRQNGIIFPLGDIAALAAALRRLLEDADLRRSCGRESVALVKKYDFETDVKGLREALRTCLDSRQS